MVRPLHEAHAYETALILTEAFLIDRQPPEFPWMLCAARTPLLPRPASGFRPQPLASAGAAFWQPAACGALLAGLRALAVQHRASPLPLSA